MNEPLVMMECNLPKLGKPKKGKVREMFDLGDFLLMVATDRISAFDVVMPNGIPGKGVILNMLSALWFRRLADIIPNHLVTCDPSRYPADCLPYTAQLCGRSMLVKKTKPLPIECVVRGHLAGSGWKSYQEDGTVCGLNLPAGLGESEGLLHPIFTPATKAASGHDENISFERAVSIVSAETAELVREKSLALFREARILALHAGIIIADTKFEFGIDQAGQVILIDEALTPDSSRFWPADRYQPGRPQPSFDKQYLRDYLEASGWNKQPPAPELPFEVVKATREKYEEAFQRLSPILGT